MGGITTTVHGGDVPPAKLPAPKRGGEGCLAIMTIMVYNWDVQAAVRPRKGSAVMAKTTDERGYTASEKNRQFSPEQVVWARNAVFHRRTTASEIARLWGVGTESVRKMLRGDTYANVGRQLPAPQQSVEREIDNIGEKVFQELLAEGLVEGAGPAKAPEVSDADRAKEKDAAVEAFIAGKADPDPFSPE